MNRKHSLATMALGLCLAIPATALGQGKVTITAPLDGATLDSMSDNHLVYEVDPGPREKTPAGIGRSGCSPPTHLTC
jgi:hypothetical protein